MGKKPTEKRSGSLYVEVWLTQPDQSALCAKQPGYLPVSPPDAERPIIRVNPARRHQVMDGFGFALTGGSADLIAQLPFATRKALLRELFLTDDDGIGITYLRISIGASDLSSKPFSYDDVSEGEADTGLDRFNLEAGDVQLIPVLKQILAINPDIRLIATPWSAPPWMKSNQSFVGGMLNHEHYQVYAKYIITYINRFRSNGITISAITPQNEPLNLTDNPSMGMSAAEQADFIGNHLGPALYENGLGAVALFCYDHNCDRPDYPIAVLADAKARRFVTGVAWHLYGGKPQALSRVARKYPGIKTYFTEQYVGAGQQFGADLDWHVRNVLIGTIRNGAQAVLEWNLASAPDYGPHTPGGCNDCLGALTIDASAILRNLSYYIIAHLSRFVAPGSIRVSSTAIASLPSVAFVTPDERAVLLVLNGTNDFLSFGIQWYGQTVLAALDGGAVGTYVWQLGPGPVGV
jgi:glucosylceramidase